MALTKITRGVIKANENYDTHNINSTGIVTAVSANFTGNVSIGGTLTYQDVTNIDSVGVITARNGIDVTGGTVTITTGANSASPAASGDNLIIKDSNGCGLSILSGNANSQNIYLGSVSDNDAVRLEGFYNSGSPYFNIYTAGSERLRITSTGNIGINKTPTTYQFEVNGGTANTVASFESTDATSRILFKDNSGEAMVGAVGDALTFYTSTNATERLRITSTGNIGIGTDTPYANNSFNSLSIGGSGKYGLIELNKSDGVAGSWIDVYGTGGNGDLRITTAGTNGSITFWTGGSFTEKVRITSDGKVGINETSPDTKLHITHSNTTEDVIKLEAKPVTAATGERSRIIFNVTQSNGQSAKLGHIASHTLNNWGGELSFSTKPANGSPNDNVTERVRITSDGIVKKPNHPCFDAVRNSGHLTATTYINYNTVKANNGGHYNSSNGRFTAPVAGYYFFSWTSIKNNTNTVTRLYIHKNGSAAYGNRHLRLDAGQDYGDNGTMTAVIQLAENDYVQIYLEAGSIYGATEEYCIFNGYLLG